MYNSEAYKAVIERFEKRRIKKEQQAEETRRKVVSVVPQIETIDAELALIASQAVKYALGRDSASAKKRMIKEFKEKSVELQAQKIELLVTAGFSGDVLDEKPSCKKCGDKGFIGAKMCECFKKELHLECYKRTKLASIINDQSFKTFDLNYYDNEVISEFGRSPKDNMKLVLEYLKDYAENFSTKSSNLILTGAPGLGKTFLSSAIAKATIDKGFYVLYDSCQNILSRMEDAKFKNANEDFSDILQCELLIIDDLGAEFKTQFSESCIYNIINSRLISKLPTIISTNLSPSELADTYHERIASRLLGEYKTILFLGTDIRFQKLEKASKSGKRAHKNTK